MGNQDMEMANVNEESRPFISGPGDGSGAGSSERVDYVLVTMTDEPKKDKREEFFNALKEKEINIDEPFTDDGKVFYRLTAKDSVFLKYQHLLKVSDSCNYTAVTYMWTKGEKETKEDGSCQGVKSYLKEIKKCFLGWSCWSLKDDEENKKSSGEVTPANRIRVVHYILNHTAADERKKNNLTLAELREEGVIEDYFCLHEETRDNLLRNWATWAALQRQQPFHRIQYYYGEKVAFYYMWLGWYTRALVPAAIIGLVIFLYGVDFLSTDTIITEVCNSTIVMCSRCDKRCEPWDLSDTCSYAKLSHLFDNEGTVAFAMLMVIGITGFLELWKRRRSKYVSEWKIRDWCEEEEDLILKAAYHPKFEGNDHDHSYFRSALVLSGVIFMLILLTSIAPLLMILRAYVTGVLSDSEVEFVEDSAKTLAIVVGAVLHYVITVIMNLVNKKVAWGLTLYEKHASRAAKERSFTIKMFLFQFSTLFSSLVYVAFFLGRVNGYPGNYSRIAGYRLEECHPSGCLTDLFIQMGTIMLLKQIINSIGEFCSSFLSNLRKTIWSSMKQNPCGCNDLCKNLKESLKNQQSEEREATTHGHVLYNYHLSESDEFTVFHEFMEMVIQFSFTIMFVAAFPLAPLLALVNNIFEIRIDAIKMTRQKRRVVPKKTNNIATWTYVLETIGILAVISNGFVIGISSDFIPRLLYRYYYGPCANGQTDVDCMAGYIRNTLTTAYMNGTDHHTFIHPSNRTLNNANPCSFRSYRSAEDHTPTSQFWLVMAARFAFVLVFEHFVLLLKTIAIWFFPSDSPTVRKNREKEKLERLRSELGIWEQKQKKKAQKEDNSAEHMV